MDEHIDSIRKSLSKIAGKSKSPDKMYEGIDKADIYLATVDSVDEANRICSCTLISGQTGLPLDAIKLMATVDDGFLLVPAVDSTVVIAAMQNIDPFVIQYSQLDKISCISGDQSYQVSPSGQQFNDGKYGGIIKVKDPDDSNVGLLKKINQLENTVNDLTNLVNDLISKYNTHVHPFTGTVTGTSCAGTTTATISTETDTGTPIDPITSESDLVNPNITHGKDLPDS